MVTLFQKMKWRIKNWTFEKWIVMLFWGIKFDSHSETARVNQLCSRMFCGQVF